jgi:hypothetical protein
MQYDVFCILILSASIKRPHRASTILVTRIQYICAHQFAYRLLQAVAYTVHGAVYV